MDPILQYSVTQNFNSVWADHGSHANMDVGFWGPNIDTSKNFFFGNFAQNGYDYPTQSMVYVSGVLNDDPDNPALRPPKQYNAIWFYPTQFNIGEYTWNLNVIWNIVPEDNYVACGSAVSSTGTIPIGLPPQPSIAGLQCLRYDLAVGKTSGLGFVWNDKGSGNSKDVSVWIEPQLHNMLAQQGYDAPGEFYQPNNLPAFAHNFGVP